MVWLIIKSKPGSRFQSWHQDFNLNKKITKTIVINLGAVKRSDLLGGPLCKVINNENIDNKGKVSANIILGRQMRGFINSDNLGCLFLFSGIIFLDVKKRSCQDS